MHQFRALLLFALLFSCPHVHALTESELETLVSQDNVEGIRTAGIEVLPQLVRRYESANVQERTRLAALFYGLGWKSEEAKAALMRDVKTEDQSLRIQVQWALGRVSGDDDVVNVLLENMRRDPNPLFRDKAACALANDQIHLTGKQKAKLYEGVIAALADEKDDVRRIAAQVLQIQTGQSKGYQAEASVVERNRAIESWQSWLMEFKKATADEP